MTKTELRALITEQMTDNITTISKVAADEMEKRISAANLSSMQVKYDFGEGDDNRSFAVGRPATRKDFKGCFGKEHLSNDGFKSQSEFLQVVSSGKYDQRLKSLIEGDGGSGGYVVPEEYAATFLDVALESEVVRPRATVYPMKFNSLKIPGFVIGNHATNLYGGVTSEWIGESETMTEHPPQFRSINLVTKKLACYAVASNELIEDGQQANFDSYLSQSLINGISFGMDYAFLQGNGAGMPLGILKSPCLITQAIETGQTADTLLWENLINMMACMHPNCFPKSVWIASLSIIPQLLTMSLPVGTGGSFIPAMSETNGQFKVLTRPVIFTEKLPKLGDKGDIILADLSQYCIGLRKEIRLEKSIHVHFQTDEQDYRCLLRVDGQPSWDSTMTLNDGTSVVSPFITLAAR
jgi:HK97 family phage major capsid protein